MESFDTFPQNENPQNEDDRDLISCTGSGVQDFRKSSNTVRYLLNSMGLIIKRLTDQRKNHDTNSMGQFRTGYMVKDIFDMETQEFLSKYLLRGHRMKWLETTCNIEFKRKKEGKEIFLSSNTISSIGSTIPTRSCIDVKTYPTLFSQDLDKPWRNLEGRINGQKRSGEPLQQEMITPTKKICHNPIISPLNKQQDDVNVNVLMPSIIPQESLLTNLGSFGYEFSNLIQSALKKSINAAILKRNVYITNANLNPLIRSNKITAMKQSLKDASRQRNQIVDVVQRIKKDISSGDISDIEEAHPLHSYILGRKDEEHQVSPFQLRKLMVQLLTVRDLLQLIADKYDIKVKLLNDALHAIDETYDYKAIDSIIISYEDRLQPWKQYYSIPSLILRVKRDHFDEGTDIATMLKWYNQFKRNNYKGFDMDLRGKYLRENFLEKHSIRETTLASRLEFFLRTESDITVAKSLEWLREFINANFPEGHEARRLKISNTTMYRWMLELGANFDENIKSYYTDNHDAPKNVKYRGIYIREQFNLSLRQPVWTYVKREEVSPEALLDLSWRGVNPTFQNVNGIEMCRVHVDFLSEEKYIEFLDECMTTIGTPGLYYYDNMNPNNDPIICRYNHDQMVCKCHLPLVHVGQDEKIWHACSIPKKGWSIKGYRRLRKKGVVVGVMTSGFVDSKRGYGLPLSRDELSAINRIRERNRKELLEESPGNVYFYYGKNKEGYWNHELFIKQIDAMIDCMEFVYPNHQILIEVDSSSGHLKYANNCLDAMALSMKWGGKQPQMHPSIIKDESYLGPYQPFLKIGDTQHFQFQLSDPPPWYDPQAEAYDRAYNDDEKNQLSRKYQQKPDLLSKKLKEGVIGYLGKQKGLKQILWERGLYVDGMLTHQSDTVTTKKFMDGVEGLPEHLDMKRVLARQPDFLAEKCALQHMIEERGHIFLKSPACHPEIAGNGIEYLWGYSSMIFRKINDCTAANLERNVRIALSNENLTLKRIWKYSRRTRDYMRMYYKLAINLEINPELKDTISYKFYEENRNQIKLESRKLVCPSVIADFLRHTGRQYSYHRNVSEIERNFINES